MQRNLFIKLKAHLKKKEFTILTGARQSGKSTLLKQLQAASSAESIPCVFLNLENKTILAALDADPLNVFTYLPSTTKRAFVFIDEIQYLQDPSNFLKLLYDDHVEKIKIIATGSSAFYLDDAFRDSLAGRKKVFQLLTCSFDEYLKLSDKQDLLDEVDRISSNKKAKSTKIAYLKNEWETYMLYGGYPAIITETVIEEKINRLKEIRDSYIKRDILEAGVQNETAFYNLFRIIAGQSGGLINVNELSATLRIKNDTVNNYLLILQKCFHIALVKPFYKNLRKEITKMPKAFMLDTGLRNCLVNNFQPTDIRFDKGELWENMCYRVLADKHGMDAIHFWRTADGSEVDFVLPEIEVPYAVEAKYDNALVKPAKYKKFTETYPEIPLQFGWMKPFDKTFFRRQ